MEQPEQIKMLLDFFNYDDLKAEEQQRVHEILHGPKASNSEPELPWNSEASSTNTQLEDSDSADNNTNDQEYMQSAAGDSSMNVPPRPQPPPTIEHTPGYGTDMVMNSNTQGAEPGMYNQQGMPPAMFQAVMDQSGNIIQVITYPRYVVGMPPHGAAGQSNTDGYIPMMGNMTPMAPHGMGAHGAHQMNMPGVPISYMEVPQPNNTGMMHPMNMSDASQGQGIPRERRNKKKRPADYYKKLEERERLAAEIPDDGSMDEINMAFNPNKPQNSVPVNMPVPCHVGMNLPAGYVNYSQMMPAAAGAYPSQFNADMTNQQHVHNLNNSISFVADLTTNQQEERDTNNSAIGAYTDESSAQIIDAKNVVNTQTSSPGQITHPNIRNETKVHTEPGVSEEEFGFSISFGSVDESHLGKKKSLSQLTSYEKPVTDNCDNSFSKEVNSAKPTPGIETVSVASQIPNINSPVSSTTELKPVEKCDDSLENSKETLPPTSVCNQTSASPAAPEKPKSWASLLHGTSTANAATVVYDTQASASSRADESKDNSTEKKDSSPSPDVVVATSDDKNARQLGEILSEYKAKYSPVSLLPRGLHNSNNWCYINATLQALLACPAFYHLMKALPAFPPLTRGPSSTPVIDALCEFFNEFEERPIQKLDGKALNAKGTVKQDVPVGSVFAPKCIFRMLNMIKDDSQFKLGKQEDAEEFLSCILNLLHEEMVAARKIIEDEKNKEEEKPPPNGDFTGENASKSIDDDEEEDGQWEQVGPRNKSVITRSAEFEKSPVSDIFRGQIRSIVHKPGAKESATLQPFFTLQLDIQNEAVWSVRDALEGFVSKETISDHKYVVRGMEVNATRRIVLEDLPKVLILHLKCFVYDKSGGSQKIIKEIEFDTDLDLHKDLLSPTARSRFGPGMRKYKLFAVVNHIGVRAIGGHYSADIFHPGLNGWLRCDDNFISSISVTSVTKFHSPKVPYLLYYRRTDLT